MRDWRTELDDPTRRRMLEEALIQVLTPDVLAPLPPPLQLAATPDAMSCWINDRAAESEVSVIRDGATQDIIGLLILVSLTDPVPSVHLGYLLAQSTWGKGYATEVLSGLVAQASSLAPITLIGGVACDNPASARVLIKAGFTRDADQSTSDTDMFALRLI